MAKLKFSGLIQSLWGKLGDVVFVRKRGSPYIRKVSVHPRSESEFFQRIKSNLSLVNKTWSTLSMETQSLWELYGKMLGYHSGCGMCAFLKTNLVLVNNGFEMLYKPPFWKKQPPIPQTDLINFGRYKDIVKFNVWLGTPFEDFCRLQVLVKQITERKEYLTRLNAFYVGVFPLPVIQYGTKTCITLSKIKGTKRGKVVEIPFKKLSPFRIWVQLKVISIYGKVSIPSARYKIEIV